MIFKGFLAFHSPHIQSIGYSGLACYTWSEPYIGKEYLNYVNGKVVGIFKVKKLHNV